MVRISRKLGNKLLSEARKAAIDQIAKEGYLTREQIASKYKINPQKVWRLIKNDGLPYNEDLEKIKESDFLEWKKKNEHLLKDRRIKS